MVKVQETKLQLIKDQLLEAQESDKDAMSSTLIVEGEMMSFEIEELKIRLREREIEVCRRGARLPDCQHTFLVCQAPVPARRPETRSVQKRCKK